MTDTNIQIVQFADGKYGLRKPKHNGEYEFKDLRADKEYWWGMDTKYFVNDCRGDRRTVEQVYYLVTDEGRPVSLSNPLEDPPIEEKGWFAKTIRFLFL